MKKIYSLILLLLCVSLGASAASKTKLYVNPIIIGVTSWLSASGRNSGKQPRGGVNNRRKRKEGKHHGR